MWVIFEPLYVESARQGSGGRARASKATELVPPTELEMAEGLAPEAAGELPELKEDKA